MPRFTGLDSFRSFNLGADVLTASERVFNVVLNTSVASTSLSWFDNRDSPSALGAVSCVDVFVLVVALVREVFVLDAAVVFKFVAFVDLPTFFTVALSTSAGLRMSVWSDNTVAFEHVDADRTVCFTDSTAKSEGKDVTAMVGYIMSLGISCRGKAGGC